MNTALTLMFRIDAESYNKIDHPSAQNASDYLAYHGLLMAYEATLAKLQEQAAIGKSQYAFSILEDGETRIIVPHETDVLYIEYKPAAIIDEDAQEGDMPYFAVSTQSGTDYKVTATIEMLDLIWPVYLEVCQPV